MVIQTLQILEYYDLRALGHNSPDYIHLVVEALKLAFSDRHFYYGDPAMVEVPAKGLLSKEYAKVRRNLIDPARAWPEMPPPGDPGSFSKSPKTRRKGSLHESKTFSKFLQMDTSYLCVVDRWGNAFSATPSDSVLDSPIIPGLGFSISARGFQSWLDPAHPSCVAPGKRPRLTPNPAIIFREGKLWMPFGTPGLDVQTQSMTQMFLNIVEFGFNAQQAVEEPRFVTFSFPQTSWPHPYNPGRLCLEGRISQKTASDLAQRGHKVEMWDDWGPAGALCGIIVDHEKGILIAGADPRRECYAVGR